MGNFLSQLFRLFVIGPNQRESLPLEVTEPALDVTENKNEDVVVDPECIFKLDVDCFEELFEWLSMEDLRALRRTCTRFKKVIDYYIESNYPNGFGMLYFDDYLQHFELFSADFCKLFKEIEISDHQLTEDVIGRIKNVHLNRVTILSNDIGIKYLDAFLQHCTNLKTLNIIFHEVLAESEMGKQWLHRHYPQLEHLIMCDYRDYIRRAKNIPELQIFFDLNPSVKVFSTTASILQSNLTWMVTSNLKFDRLIILDVDCFEFDMDQLCELLEEIFAHGFYTQLHFYAINVYRQPQIDRIATLTALEKLHLQFHGEDVNYSIPPNHSDSLKELSVCWAVYLSNLDPLDKNLYPKNIERFCFESVSSDSILRFIRHATKVKQIKIDVIEDENRFLDTITNLSALNQERKQLIDAKKITIYIREKLFLAIKLATTNTDFEFIEIQRLETIDWENAFYKRVF
ncbi:uncharacterized protein LOC129571411 [Sitodiplosis mosellana]|uniref:uncharacterized protein LOC129571411 n=1 Tax=Sitodiplosis mosellana TaxID=263140 RepID=UPI0024451C53|nr:uncharacterized protein LOC129571411 [Sitodiplosis mosellana]